MTPKLDLADIIDILLENAHTDFCKTEQYRLLREKHNLKSDNYETILPKAEKDSVEEYLEVLSELQSLEAEFVYKRGLNDCVYILKRLGVLI